MHLDSGRMSVFPQALHDVWTTIRWKTPSLLIIAVCTTIPFAAAAGLRVFHDVLWTQLLFFLLEYVCSIWLILAIVQFVIASFQGTNSTPLHAVRESLSLLLPATVLGAFLWGSIALGFLLLLLPGIWLFTLLLAALPVLIAERCSVVAAVKRSMQLSQGSRWQLFLVLSSIFPLNLCAALLMYTLSVPEFSLAPENLTAAGPAKEGWQLVMGKAALREGPLVTIAYWVGVAALFVAVAFPLAIVSILLVSSVRDRWKNGKRAVAELVSRSFQILKPHLRLVLAIVAISSGTVALGFLSSNLSILESFHPGTDQTYGLEFIPALAAWMISQGVWGMITATCYCRLREAEDRGESMAR